MDSSHEGVNQIQASNNFYGSSFHQSIDDYHGTASFDNGVVVGNAIDSSRQPYYLQSYNQLMHQRQQQQQQQYASHQRQMQKSAPLHHHQFPTGGFAPSNVIRNVIQRSEHNSGVNTPSDGYISRVNSTEVPADPALEDPAVQTFMEKRRVKKERSKEEKLMREMVVEAGLMGFSPSKLVSSDISAVEEKSITHSAYNQMEYVNRVAGQKRPSHTGHAIDLAANSTDSFEYVSRSNGGFTTKQTSQENGINDLLSDTHQLLDENAAFMKNRPLPAQPDSKVSATVASTMPIVTKEEKILEQDPPAHLATKLEFSKPTGYRTPVAGGSDTPASSNNATPPNVKGDDAPSHPLHDFSGIPKGVNFDPLHIMHADNAEILKIAAALLQRARRHPQLPKTEGIPREVAAAQLATMWLNQATFVRRKAAPNEKVPERSTSGKPAMVPFPKVSVSKVDTKTKLSTPPVSDVGPSLKQPLTVEDSETLKAPTNRMAAAVEPISLIPHSSSRDEYLVSNKKPTLIKVSPTHVSTKDHYAESAMVSAPIPHNDLLYSTNLAPPNHVDLHYELNSAPIHHNDPHFAMNSASISHQNESHFMVNHDLYDRPSSNRYQPPLQSFPPQPPHSEHQSRTGSRDFNGDAGMPYLAPQQGHYTDSPGSGQRGRKIMRVPMEENLGQYPSPMGTVRPDYARERSASEGYFDNNPRSAPMIRQTSSNQAPPLIQQMSRRMYEQQQLHQPMQQGYIEKSYENSYAHPTSSKYHQPQGNLQYNSYGDSRAHENPVMEPYGNMYNDREYVSDLEDEDSYEQQYEDREFAANGGNTGVLHPNYSHQAPPPPSKYPPSQPHASNYQPAPSRWTCKYCTLINDASAARCSACEAPRSKGPLIV